MIVTRPYAFWLLLLLVPLAAAGIRKFVLGRRDFVTLAGDWRAREAGFLYACKSFVVAFAGLGVFVSAVLALAGLEAGERVVSEERDGNAVMIALDISHSMLAEDAYPTRLGSSVRSIGKLVSGMKGASFGLVIFKGKAVHVWPLSDDREAIADFLSTVKPGFITSPGTNLGAAVDACLDAFAGSGKYESIVLFTDGENLDGDFRGASNRALAMNVPVITVLIGTEKGAYVPNPSGGFVKDDAGKNVVTRANKGALEEIARITKGRLVTADRSTDLVKEVSEASGGKTGGKGGVGYRIVKDELYPYFLALALVFLALGTVARGVRWKKLL